MLAFQSQGHCLLTSLPLEVTFALTLECLFSLLLVSGKTDLNVTAINETFHNSTTESGQCGAEISEGKQDYGYEVYRIVKQNIADMYLH